MKRIAALALLVAACSDGSSYVLVDVTSGPTLTLTELDVSITNNGQTASSRIAQGGSFTIPPDGTFAIKFDSSRRGTVEVEVHAIGTSGEVAHASGSTEIAPSGTARLMLSLTASPMDMGSDLPPPADLSDLAQVVWTPQISGTGALLSSVWGNGKNVWVAGAGGTILRTSDGGGTWSLQTSNTTNDLYGVWGVAGTNELFAVGASATILHTTDGATWTPQAAPLTNFAINGVWGAGNGTVFATTSSTGTIYFTTDNGTTWKTQPSNATEILRAVWGSKDTDVYSVGDAGTIAHLGNGGAWATQASGTQQALAAIWGSGSNDVYAVGGNSLILHSGNGGATWTATQSQAAASFHGLWGSAANDVYAVGSGGVIVHGSDGADWVALDSGTKNDLFAVWGNGAGDVFVVGQGGTILHGN